MPTEGRDHHRLAFAFSLGASLLAGIGMAFQSRMNGELARVTGQPIMSAWWSFGSGLVILALLTVLPSQRRAWGQLRRAVAERRLRWWMLAAGMFGGFLVGTQAAVVPLVGVAVFSVAVVGGQTAGGLFSDALGLGPAAPERVTLVRGIAAAGALAGVVLAATASGGGAVHLLPVVITVIAGFLTTVQNAWNGRITAEHGQPLVTTTLNFLTGAVALVVYGAARIATGGAHVVPLHGPWWVWWGGIFGLLFVATGAVVVRYIGVLLFILMTLVSQLATALLLDVVNPQVSGAASPQRLAGLAVTAVAAGLAGWAAARARRRNRAPGAAG